MPLPHAASQRGGPRRVESIIAQGLPWVHASIVGVGQEGRPRELSWRAWEGHSVVALVSGFKRCRRIDAGVGQRGVAEGLRGIGVIVQIEVTGSVDAGLAVREIQGQGLALLDVA